MGSVNQSPTIKHLMLVLLRSTFTPMLSSRTTPDKCKTASSVTFAHRGCSIDFVLGNSGTINLPSNFLRVARAGPCSDCSGAMGHRGAFSSISAEVNGKVGVVGLVGGGFIKGLGVGILLASVSLSEADSPYLWAPPIKLPSDKNSAELRTWPTLLAVHSGKASRVERRQRQGRESGWLVLRGCRCVLKCCAHTHTHSLSPVQFNHPPPPHKHTCAARYKKSDRGWQT